MDQNRSGSLLDRLRARPAQSERRPRAVRPAPSRESSPALRHGPEQNLPRCASSAEPTRNHPSQTPPCGLDFSREDPAPNSSTDRLLPSRSHRASSPPARSSRAERLTSGHSFRALSPPAWSPRPRDDGVSASSSSSPSPDLVDETASQSSLAREVSKLAWPDELLRSPSHDDESSSDTISIESEQSFLSLASPAQGTHFVPHAPFTCSKDRLREFRRNCRIARDITLIAPLDSETLKLVREGYCCAYEVFFRSCGLTFPLPEILVYLMHAMGAALGQMCPNLVRSLVFP